MLFAVVYAHTHACTCAHMRTHTHMLARTHVHTHIRTHARTHACTHAHTHTHTHTHAQEVPGKAHAFSQSTFSLNDREALPDTDVADMQMAYDVSRLTKLSEKM